MMSSNVALLHSNNCCVLEPAICEDLDLHVVIFMMFSRDYLVCVTMWIDCCRIIDVDFVKKCAFISCCAETSTKG